MYSFRGFPHFEQSVTNIAVQSLGARIQLSAGMVWYKSSYVV